MVKKITFPKFDANITEGMVGVWRKNEGDRVRPGDPIVEIITDKATFDLESDTAGTLRKIIAKEKSAVPVGYIIALIGDDAGELLDVSEENERLIAEHRKATLEASGKRNAKSLPRQRVDRVRVRAAPAARRLAREAGIDIANIPPSDGSPVITEEDVRDYLQKTSDKGATA